MIIGYLDPSGNIDPKYLVGSLRYGSLNKVPWNLGEPSRKARAKLCGCLDDGRHVLAVSENLEPCPGCWAPRPKHVWFVSQKQLWQGHICIYIYPIPIHLLGRRAFLKIGRRSKSSEGYIREIFWGKETAYSIWPETPPFWTSSPTPQTRPMYRL